MCLFLLPIKIIWRKDDLKNLKKIFDEIIFISIRKIDFIEIAIKALFFRLTKNIPLQASWLNSQKLINDFNNKIFYLQTKYKNIFIHIYSIRTYFLWDIIEKSKNPFVIDLVDSMTLNLKRKCSILKILEIIFGNLSTLVQNFSNRIYHLLNIVKNILLFLNWTKNT